MSRLVLGLVLMAAGCGGCALIRQYTAPLPCSTTSYQDSSSGCSELENYPDCHPCRNHAAAPGAAQHATPGFLRAAPNAGTDSSEATA